MCLWIHSYLGLILCVCHVTLQPCCVCPPCRARPLRRACPPHYMHPLCHACPPHYACLPYRAHLSCRMRPCYAMHTHCSMCTCCTMCAYLVVSVPYPMWGLCAVASFMTFSPLEEFDVLIKRFVGTWQVGLQIARSPSSIMLPPLVGSFSSYEEVCVLVHIMVSPFIGKLVGQDVTNVP